MDRYEIDPASGSRLIGGEMLQWSDLDGGPDSGALVHLIHRLVGASGRGASVRRVLLLGPRASFTTDAMPHGATLDLLVRGLPDARSLSTLRRMREGVTIWCGSVDLFEPAQGYDLVVALDGPETLCSVDSPGLGHLELIQRLAQWTAPGGTVVAVLANQLAMDRLFQLEVRPRLDDERQWYRGANGFDTRALYFRELGPALASAGLVTSATFATYPTAESPSLLVDVDHLVDDVVRSAASLIGARSETTLFSSRPALADVYDLTLRLFESDLADQLAPGWLVVATSGHEADAATTARLPALLATDDVGLVQWRAVTTLEQEDHQWAFRMRPVLPAAEMQERLVLRDFTALPGSLPRGQPLEWLMRQACAGGNVANIRALVRRYATWLRDATVFDAGQSAARFFAVPSNVLEQDGRLSCFDASWRWQGSLSDDEVVTRGLRDFAHRLLRSGAEHPWAPDISPDALTETLCSMAGIRLSPRLLDRAARADAELTVVVQGGGAAREAQVYAEILDHGMLQAAVGAGPQGYREVLATSGRMAQALDDRTGQVSWLEATLRARDTRVAEVERTLEAVRGSVSFRIGRFFTWPLRSVALALRRAGTSALPHGFEARLQRLLRRLAG